MNELIKRMKAAHAEMKRLADLRGTEGRDWTTEDESAWVKCNKDYDEARAAYDAAKKVAEIDAAFNEPTDDGRIGRDDYNPRAAQRAAEEVTEEDRARAFRSWIRAQMGDNIDAKDQEACDKLGFNPFRRSQLEFGTPTQTLRGLSAQFRNGDKRDAIKRAMEYRAPMTTGTLSTGGATIPETLVRNLEVNMLAFGGVRQVADIIVTASGEPMLWPTANDTGNSGSLVAESGNLDNSGAGSAIPSFAQVRWDAYKFSSGTVLIPYELLQDSVFDMASQLGSWLGERLGRGTASYFATGTGSSQPKGIVTAATLGRTAASATAIDYDDIIRLEHSVDPAYRAGAGYLCHDNIILALRLLKDGNGQYLWRSGVDNGAPDTLNGRPISTCQEMASSVATTNKVLLFGQLSKYKIRRAGGIRLYRLQERYRDQDQDGFVALVREDGNLLDAGTAPVKYLQMA